ncbi:DUF1254 domain-containing protein [Alcaligenaceae bacterium A4P071]|nr:DUF1254 domain-containing protein [Alcaligenaceae bacterium A4P071]
MRPVRYVFLAALCFVGPLPGPLAGPLAGSLALAAPPAATGPAGLSPSAIAARDDARIAEQTYLYAYPLVLMDLTRRQDTNVNVGSSPDRGPANRFIHRAADTASGGDQSATEAARSRAWLDLEDGPIVLSLPDTRGRDYTLTLSDMWGDVIAVLGKRTTGTAARNLIVVPSGWAGTLPSNLATITATTSYLRARLRVQTFGSGDSAQALEVQNTFAMTPLSAWQSSGQAVHVRADPGINMLTTPREQIARMTPPEFFAYVADLLRRHAPHATDQPLIARMARLGIKPGQRLRPDDLTPTAQRALRMGAAAAHARLAQPATATPVFAGWRLPSATQGVYGNDYLTRARAAWSGENGVSAEDEWRAVAVQDAAGEPLDGAHAYTLRFEADALPPGLSGWSLRSAAADGTAIDGSRARLLTDRSPLVYNADGSLDLVLQSEPPAAGDTANWLRLPTGSTSVILHLFTADATAIDGAWTPPALVRAD